MENKKLKLDFEMTISDVVDLNKSFASAKVLIAYTGRNRNYSDIGKTAFIDALPSIKNIPLVGRYDVDKDDFNGHDVKVINKEDGIDIVNATIPFGVVPESANQWFETRIVNGEEKECLFTDVVLWKRQHGYERIVSAGTLGQSMEINIDSYIVDNDGYCVVDKFQFEALTILGDDITPCFENACVQMYSNEIVSDFKLQFSEMLREFKELNQPSTMEVDIDKNDGGSTMTEEIKNEVVDEMAETVVEENVDEAVEETVEEVVEEVVETTDEPTDEVIEETVEDENFENTEEVVEETTEETVVEEETNEDFSVLYSELKEKYDALEKEFSDYKEEHSYLNCEYETLAQFKSDKEAEERKNAENTLFSDYEERIGETEEFKELKKNSSEFSLEALKKECLCIVGMYSMTTEVKETKKPDSLKFSFEPKEETNDDPYGGIREKYLKK
jgi:hypothetical protein